MQHMTQVRVVLIVTGFWSIHVEGTIEVDNLTKPTGSVLPNTIPTFSVTPIPTPKIPLGPYSMRTVGPFEMHTRTAEDKQKGIDKLVVQSVEQYCTLSSRILTTVDAVGNSIVKANEAAEKVREVSDKAQKVMDGAAKASEKITKGVTETLDKLGKAGKLFESVGKFLSVAGPAMAALSAVFSVAAMFMPQPDSPELAAIKKGFADMEKRFDKLEAILSNMQERIDAQFDRIHSRFDRVERQLSNLERDVQEVLKEFEKINIHTTYVKSFGDYKQYRIKLKSGLEQQRNFQRFPNWHAEKRFLEFCTGPETGHIVFSYFESAILSELPPTLAVAIFDKFKYDLQYLVYIYSVIMGDVNDAMMLTTACYAHEVGRNNTGELSKEMQFYLRNYTEKTRHAAELIHQKLKSYIADATENLYLVPETTKQILKLHRDDANDLTLRKIRETLMENLKNAIPMVYAFHVDIFSEERGFRVRTAGRHHLVVEHGKIVFISWVYESESHDLQLLFNKSHQIKNLPQYKERRASYITKQASWKNCDCNLERVQKHNSEGYDLDKFLAELYVIYPLIPARDVFRNPAIPNPALKEFHESQRHDLLRRTVAPCRNIKGEKIQFKDHELGVSRYIHQRNLLPITRPNLLSYGVVFTYDQSTNVFAIYTQSVACGLFEKGGFGFAHVFVERFNYSLYENPQTELKNYRTTRSVPSASSCAFWEHLDGLPWNWGNATGLNHGFTYGPADIAMGAEC